MKKLILKIGVFTVLLTMTVFFANFLYSCSNEDNSIQEESLLVEKRTFTFEGARTDGSLDLSVEFIYDEINEEPVSIIASDDMLNYLDMTDDELEQYVDQQMQTYGDGDDDGDTKEHNHADCISTCMEKYTNEDGTKKPGRGACKFNCWVSTAVQIIEAIGNL